MKQSHLYAHIVSLTLIATMQSVYAASSLPEQMLMQTMHFEGVTSANIPIIRDHLQHGYMHARDKKSWNLLHYLAVSEVCNRKILPLMQQVINDAMRTDLKFKMSRTDTGKTAQELAYACAQIEARPLTAMYHSRALFLRDFRTEPAAAIPIHRVLSLYNSNHAIAEEAQREILALEKENPKEYALTVIYLHDRPDTPRERGHKESGPVSTRQPAFKIPAKMSAKL